MTDPPCTVCDAGSRLVVNGAAYCSAHAWTGIKHAAQIEAMEKGAPPELADLFAVGMVLDLLHTIEGDDG